MAVMFVATLPCWRTPVLGPSPCQVFPLGRLSQLWCKALTPPHGLGMWRSLSRELWQHLLSELMAVKLAGV